MWLLLIEEQEKSQKPGLGRKSRQGEALCNVPSFDATGRPCKSLPVRLHGHFTHSTFIFLYQLPRSPGPHSMGRMLLWMSVTVCSLAVLFSLDSLEPIRSQLGNFVPDSVISFCRKAKSAAFSFISRPERLFSREELSKYTGEKGGDVYIAILGRVYDVTRGRKHYGPGGGYSFFSGRDGSRAFVSGDFTEKGLTDDVTGFTGAEVLSLEEWKDFYQKDYTYVGKLVGNFYNSEGKPTAALVQYEQSLQKALAEKKAEEDQRLIFPPCNSQWSQGGHTLVWCTNRSGGIERDWVGVPRQYFQPGKTRGKPRCVCVRSSGPPSDAPDKSHKNRGDLDNPNMKLYDGCDANADSCSFIRTED